MNEKKNRSTEKFSVTIRDDGYHPLETDNFYEWWYFDGIFTNGYSMAITYHFGMPHSKGKNARFIEFGLYDPEGRKRFTRTKLPIEECNAAEDRCEIRMGRNTVKGSLSKVEILFEGKGIGCNLSFISMTPGFKPYPDGFLHRDPQNGSFFGWACIQPRAFVEGYLLIDEKKIQVQGEGYHDHNWGDVPPSYFFDYWYWLKLFLPEHTFNCFASRGSKRYGLSDMDHWVIGFHGQILIQWSHQMNVEMTNYFKDPNTGTMIPRDIRMTVNDTNIKGTIICIMKKLLESFPMPGEQRGYFRFLVDCHVQLRIGEEQVNEKIEVINELMKPS